MANLFHILFNFQLKLRLDQMMWQYAQNWCSYTLKQVEPKMRLTMLWNLKLLMNFPENLHGVNALLKFVGYVIIFSNNQCRTIFNNLWWADTHTHDTSDNTSWYSLVSDLVPILGEKPKISIKNRFDMYKWSSRCIITIILKETIN